MPNFPVLPATLPFALGLANELTYFVVKGAYGDIENPLGTGTGIQPAFGIVSASVTFFARIPSGVTLFIPDLDMQNGMAEDVALSFPPVQGRILGGQLKTINRTDTETVELIACSSVISTALSQLGLGTSLIYDVQFSNVTFAGAPQVINNFAFTAPTTATTITLSSPTLTRLPYAGPSRPFVLP